MRHRNRRLATIAAAGIVLAAAVGLGLTAMRSAIVYFYSPSEVMAEHPAFDERVRVGGLVETGSVDEESDGIFVREIVVKPIPFVTVTVRQEFEIRATDDGVRLCRASPSARASSWPTARGGTSSRSSWG